MAPSNALRARSITRGSICYLELFGLVDESFDPNLLLGEANARKVILNLRAITRLSSFGVREWTNAMRQLCQKVERVYLVQCSPVVVSQLNMVANFSGDAQIMSVQAPFYCELCGWETDLTVHLEQDKAVELPELGCEQCSAAMTFDDDPASYFAFPLQAAQDGSVDQSVVAFLRHVSEEGAAEAMAQEPRTVVGVDAVPPPIRSSTVPRGIPPRAAPPASFLAKTRPVLIGLAIPSVVAAVIAISWPSSDELPESERLVYQEHLKAERFEEAKSLVERLEREKKVSPERAKLLEDELVAQALAGYGEHIVAGQYEEAAVLVSKLVDDHVLPPSEGARLHKEITRATLNRYSEMVAARRFEDAESLVKPLERKGVLLQSVRLAFEDELSRERGRLSASCRRDVLRYYKEGRYQEALAAARQGEMFGPLEDDVAIAVSESRTRLKTKP